MIGKNSLVLLLSFFITLIAAAQKPVKEQTIDSTFEELDYDVFFNELDALLDSLTAPKSFLLFNLGNR